MKVTFYKSILETKEITPADKIVFCQMLYVSLMDKNCSFSFSSDGEFSTELYEDDFGGYVPIPNYVSEQMITDILDISRRQYYLSCQRLKKAGYIVKNEFGKCLKLISLSPYFELKVKTGLRNLALIVYSYIAHKEERYGYVDTYHDALARDLHISFSSLEKILSSLYANNLVQSKRVHYQRILKTTLPGER